MTNNAGERFCKHCQFAIEIDGGEWVHVRNGWTTCHAGTKRAEPSEGAWR
jgi:hypothetical protein